MPRIPGIDDAEVYFGFNRNIQDDWRGKPRQPVDAADLSAMLGFDVTTLNDPPDSPGILVKRARKHAGTHDLAPAFEMAASLPDYLPPEMHADAWRQAHRIAAGAAMEQPKEAAALETLARGAMRYARKFSRRSKKAGVPPGTPAEVEVSQEVEEHARESPVRRWRDARGYVHAPKPPKQTCVEQSPGPRGGRIWDCGPGKKQEKPANASQASQATPEAHPPGTAQKGSISIEQAQNLIVKTRENPTPEKVAALAVMLARLPKEQLRQLKREQGVRADDNTKAGLAAKIAKAATVRLTQREYWMQQARKDGVRPEDMLLQSREIRTAYNEGVDTVNKMIAEARETYAKQFGKLITRRMSAFSEGGDHNQIRGFDVLARQMAGQEQYQPLLGAHGYTSEGVNPNEEEAAQKLFAFFAAGKLPRMSFGESQKRAIDLIKSSQRKPAEEATPFQRQGESVHA